MKRIISIVLALVLVLTLVPMAFASADNTCEKVIITFDDSSERYAVAHTYDWNHTIGTVDGIDSGNVAYITLASSKGNSLGIKLPAGWRAYEPTAIKFWFKADTAGTYNVGFGSTFGTSTTDTTNAALCSQGLTVEGTKEGAYVEVSLDGIALSDIVYMAIKGNGTIYIDNITLVCDASMKNAAYNWTTLVDWEDGTSAAVTSASAVTVSASTDVATGTVSTSAASIYAKTSGWDSQEKTNYITIELDADKIANADDIRMFVKQATSSSKDHFGVVIDDVTYWRKNVISNYWQALYVLDETFTSQADSTTVTMTSDDVKKVTAIKLSFNQNTMYGTDITADDIEYAVFSTGSIETPDVPDTEATKETTTEEPTTEEPTTEEPTTQEPATEEPTTEEPTTEEPTTEEPTTTASSSTVGSLIFDADTFTGTMREDQTAKTDDIDVYTMSNSNNNKMSIVDSTITGGTKALKVVRNGQWDAMGINYADDNLGTLAATSIGFRVWVTADTDTSSVINNFTLGFRLTDADGNHTYCSADGWYGQNKLSIPEGGGYVEFYWDEIEFDVNASFNAGHNRLTSASNTGADSCLTTDQLSTITAICIVLEDGAGTTGATYYVDNMQFIYNSEDEIPTTVPTTQPDEPNVVTVVTDEKASIRLNALTGIRFYTTIDSEQLAEYEAEGYTVEMGTLISTKELVGDGELSFDFTGTKVDVAFTSDELYTEDGFTGVVGSVVNIKDSNISKDFIGRGYVKLTKDGETEIFYSETVSVRSAKTIATALKADDSIYSTLTAAHKELVDKWADVE